MYLFGHSFPNCATNLQKLPESRKFFATFFAASHLITPWKGGFRSAHSRGENMERRIPIRRSRIAFGYLWFVFREDWLWRRIGIRLSICFAPERWPSAPRSPVIYPVHVFATVSSFFLPSRQRFRLSICFAPERWLSAPRSPVIYPVHVFSTMSSFFLPSR